MRNHSYRGLRLWAAGGLTAALLTAGTAGPAGAADGEPADAAPIPVAITGPDTYDLPLDADPAEGEPQLRIGLRGPGEDPEPDGDGIIWPLHHGEYTVTIDATGLEGVADVELPCDAEGLVAVCTEWELYAGESYNRDWGIGLTPAAGSEAGATGTITVTGRGEGLEFTGHSVDVRVGGPEFRTRRLTEPEGFAAGDTFRAPLGFYNVGGLPADGAVLRFSGTRGLSFPQEFRNCEYAVENEGSPWERRTALCTFEGTFEAGTAYRVATPVKVRTADFALQDAFSYGFTTLGAGEADRLRASGEYRRGKGGKLALRAVRDADPADYVRYAELDLPTANTYDLDLTGDSAHGGAGETVAVDVTLENHGPAWLALLRSGGEPVTFTVEAPEGATFTEVPEDCHPRYSDEGTRTGDYRCMAFTPLLESDRRDFAFELRIDEAVEGARGRVHLPEWWDRQDGDPSNNEDWIVLNGARA